MVPRFAHRRQRRRWWAAPVAAGAALLVVAGWGLVAHQPHLPSAGPAPVLVQAPVLSQPVAQAPGQAPDTAFRSAVAQAAASRDQMPMPAVLPIGAREVQIPSLHVRAVARPESVHAGMLTVPGDPAEVGWWMPSTGELVLDGHVDMEGVGPGALFGLRTIRPGAAVTVQTGKGTEHWTVDGVRTYAKGHVPAALFTGLGPRLVLVTCGGPFDEATHHYGDNVLVYASPAT